jgi:hypothetical protein
LSPYVYIRKLSPYVDISLLAAGNPHDPGRSSPAHPSGK